MRDVARVASAIREADALLIGAGAGMGVDSGLPDFRGDEGFWNAYPPFKKRGLDFYDLANPRWFDDDPELAWGFYGHRLSLYRDTQPHDGFDVLSGWIDEFDLDAFVFTSNVDGQFQKAGFAEERILECHGSIHHLQCAEPCHREIWSADETSVTVDRETFRAEQALPECSGCGGVARPNVLMFGDRRWIAQRTARQRDRFHEWSGRLEEIGRHVVIECGAGTAVPTVRMQCERVASQPGGLLVRINPREPEVPAGGISMAEGAQEALLSLDDAVRD